METRWFRTYSGTYTADEDGSWRGHWIGRAWSRQHKLRGLSFASRRRGRVWAFWVGRDRLSVHQLIVRPELLYLTSDPYEVPLVMPTWARIVPDLAAKIDAGYELHRRGHELAAERGLPLKCACE